MRSRVSGRDRAGHHELRPPRRVAHRNVLHRGATPAIATVLGNYVFVGGTLSSAALSGRWTEGDAQHHPTARDRQLLLRDDPEPRHRLGQRTARRPGDCVSPISRKATATSCASTGPGSAARWSATLRATPTIPNNATRQDAIRRRLKGPINWNDDYGTRMRGYVHPPTTGDYVFWISSDDNSELWLSTDEDPAHKVQIAERAGVDQLARVDQVRLAAIGADHADGRAQVLHRGAGQGRWRRGQPRRALAAAGRRLGGPGRSRCTHPRHPTVAVGPAARHEPRRPCRATSVPRSSTARRVELSVGGGHRSRKQRAPLRGLSRRSGVRADPLRQATRTPARSPGVRHRYQVSAVNPFDFASGRSATISVAPAGIVAAAARNATTVQIVFTEPMDRTRAEQAANYAISGGKTVTAAVLQADR